jgi:hypothetical protein
MRVRSPLDADNAVDAAESIYAVLDAQAEGVIDLAPGVEALLLDLAESLVPEASEST